MHAHWLGKNTYIQYSTCTVICMYPFLLRIRIVNFDFYDTVRSALSTLILQRAPLIKLHANLRASSLRVMRLLQLSSDTIYSTTRNMVAHTITGLNRWSCQNGELPRLNLHTYLMLIFAKACAAVSQVKALHVYDFDNTCRDCRYLSNTFWHSANRKQYL